MNSYIHFIDCIMKESLNSNLIRHLSSSKFHFYLKIVFFSLMLQFFYLESYTILTKVTNNFIHRELSIFKNLYN